MTGRTKITLLGDVERALRASRERGAGRRLKDLRKPVEVPKMVGRKRVEGGYNDRVEEKRVRGYEKRVARQEQGEIELPLNSRLRERMFLDGLSGVLRRQIRDEERLAGYRASAARAGLIADLVEIVKECRGKAGAAAWPGQVALCRLAKLCGVKWDGRLAEPTGTWIFNKAMTENAEVSEWLLKLGQQTGWRAVGEDAVFAAGAARAAQEKKREAWRERDAAGGRNSFSGGA